MDTPAGLPMRQFLGWVQGGTHRYAAAMDAWRSSCPRFMVWEDALCDGLVRIDGVGAACMAEARVVLTPAGAALLAAVGQPSSASASGETAPSWKALTTLTGPSAAPGAMSSEITVVQPASPAVASSRASQ